MGVPEKNLIQPQEALPQKKSRILEAIKAKVRQDEELTLGYEDYCDHHEADH